MNLLEELEILLETRQPYANGNAEKCYPHVAELIQQLRAAQQARVPDVCPADGGKHSWHPNKDNYLIYSCRKCGARG